MFSFNNPFGACKKCDGLGTFKEIDPDLIIPDKKMSINQGAIKASGWNVAEGSSIILNDVYIGDNTHIENCIVESRDTLKANTYYCGENGIKIVSEHNERYVL